MEYPDVTREISRTHERKSRWRRAVSALACGVVFCTVYALILPAITLTAEPLCGQTEHAHTRDCYETILDCTLERETAGDENSDAGELSEGEGHIHGPDCYRQVLQCTLPEHTHDQSCYPQGDETYCYEDETMALKVRVLSPEPLPGEAELAVTALDAAAPTREEDTLWLARGIALLQDGEPLDLSDCVVTAEVTLKDETLEPLAAEAAALVQKAAPEAEVGVLLSAWHWTEETELAAEETLLLTETAEPLTVSVEDGLLLLSAQSTANPSYTVQYYAEIPVFATTGDDTYALTVIDTSKTGGGSLPKNGGSITTKKLYLKATGKTTENSELTNQKNFGEASTIYTLATSLQLTEMYSVQGFQYIYAPNPSYVDKLEKNSNYTLKEVWILKDGKSAESTDRNDWDICQAGSTRDVHFTNRQDVEGDNILYIADDAVIRLVYSVTSAKDLTAETTFYDYDISSGQNGDGRWETGAAGINSQENYSTSADGKTTWESYENVLAFGNENCGTGMGQYLFEGGYLNARNEKNSNAGGCTFGLVESLAKKEDSGSWADAVLVYDESLSVPKLFNDGTATGKQTYANSSLTFTRTGDTYTLSSAKVNGLAEIGGLDEFFNPSPKNGTIYDGKSNKFIATNNFWPLDTAAETQRTDPNIGKNGDQKSYQGYVSQDGKGAPWTAEATDFPISDDGQAHNCFFGMNFSLEFTLTEDYVGPLEYLFYGDDDMWVFLDGELVCDIGGVHSSVGEYVDLWDYLEKGSSGTHTLSFFYTERGASGSTCYMSFTLPSVSGVTTQQETGSLTVTKKALGFGETERDFSFTIRLLDATGSSLLDDYAYTKYSANGSSVESSLVLHDGSDFTLKDGEYLVIQGLPHGTQYVLTEDNGDYTTVWQLNGGNYPGRTITGSIPKDSGAQLCCANVAPTVGLTVQKEDPGGKALSGAVFTLKDSDGQPLTFRKEEDGSYAAQNPETTPALANGTYYLLPAEDETLAVTAEEDGTAILQQYQAGSDAQRRLTLTGLEDGSYTLESGGSYLGVSGTAVQYSSTSQSWYLLENGSGSYMLRPKQAVVDAAGGALDLSDTPAEGVSLCLGTAARQWKLLPADSGQTTSLETTTDLAVGDNGTLRLSGLIPGSYTLCETQAPDGYAPAADICLAVSGDGNVTLAEERTDAYLKEGEPLLRVVDQGLEKTLTLKKEVLGVQTNQPFTFLVTYRYGEEDPVENTLTLTNGESNTFQIPYGAAVTIQEQDHNGFAVLFKYLESGESGSVVEQHDGSSCTFIMTGDLSILAQNSSGYALPKTGGYGTLGYTLGGTLLMAAALWLWLRRREGGTA